MGKEVAEIRRPASRGSLRAKPLSKADRQEKTKQLARRVDARRGRKVEGRQPRRGGARRTASHAGLVPLGRDFHTVREVSAK